MPASESLSPKPAKPDTQQTAAREKREKWVHVKASADERAAWKAAAAAEKLTVSDLIRRRMGAPLEGRAPKKTRAARRADPQLIQSVGRVGSNLNQIAKWCNTHATGADAVQVLAALVAIDQSLSPLVFSSYRPDVLAPAPALDAGDAE